MRALVLGGGGITGIAWELGLLSGLRRHGTDLAKADLIVGTSAGAYVGALLATGVDIDDAADAAARIEIEFTARIDPMLVAQGFMLLNDTTLSPRDLRARLGTLARQAPVGDDGPHVARFAGQLPAHDWPTVPRLIITAVDTTTGDPAAWDATSAVPLPAAVAASCALPGVFPPVRIEESWYMDGGVHSVTHADLAAGADAVVVLAPSGGMFRASPASEIAGLGIDRSLLIAPDDATRAAIGGNILDARRRGPVLRAGAAQAEHVAAAVAGVWA
ncbi:patatin-like phospholipase family protein [Couchioplanes caeruleus]|uniref:patatin-like phospholipase family protein n=1 Tax=Couchioplanes caeruleus TaxID=56438 RepID=UPI0020BF840F|nr:patatin-like phospholipase family protein [Couchioplanes caeruleus]UQU67049.1 patatin-like phospholipase family protein [Couchioplanes caeruleus]